MTSSLSPKNRRATTVLGVRASPRLAVAHTNPRVIDVPARNITTAICAGEKQQYKLTKLLVNVNIQNSLGPVHLVMTSEKNVGELIKAAIDIYVKEKRRPLLTSSDPLCYQLHYSQFSLESLKTEEKLVNLGCRSFFLCPKPNTSSCADKAMATTRSQLPLTKLMDFVL
ncbi:uncharacterized protein LOC132043766 [Lycium ferocissimum]|uniref:uncharacterized protein LOC132043766 n=1 Tax=Lycium ferocissimum TaxID=112874 RepID=UPI002815A52D|nr:uncharacterized protein LOC132043766 [Lycium ferocissimum]